MTVVLVLYFNELMAIQILAPLELSSLLNPDERNSQKITVKLFLSTPKPEFVKSALNAGMLVILYFCNEIESKFDIY